MATINLDDHPLRRQLRYLLANGMGHAQTALVSHLQLKVNVSARVAATQGRYLKGGGGKRAKPSRSYRYVPSAPGEPPRKRTGTLQKSVSAETILEPDAVVTRVGSKVPYAVFLEYGTTKMAARPWLRPGVSEFADRFHRLVLDYVRARFKTGGMLG